MPGIRPKAGFRLFGPNLLDVGDYLGIDKDNEPIELGIEKELGEEVYDYGKPGSSFVPPEGWYHHHFTTSKEPARHLALRRGLRKVGHLVEQEDEPPEIRAMYKTELKTEDIPFRMRPIERRHLAGPPWDVIGSRLRGVRL